MKHVYVCYAPESAKDGQEVVDLFKQHSEAVFHSISNFFSQPYPRGKNYLLLFLGHKCLSGSYMSNNEVEWYKRIVVSKRAFKWLIAYKWDIFTDVTVEEINKVLSKMPKSVCFPSLPLTLIRHETNRIRYLYSS